MKTARRMLAVAGLVGLALASQTATGEAQGPGRGRGQGMYDPSTESTVSGTVTRVEPVTPDGRVGRRGLGGLHLTLETGGAPMAVHLGPVAFLEQEGLVVEEGERLEILGSRVSMGGETVLLAREVRKGDRTWTLRDTTGRPRWSGRGRQ